MMNLRPIAIPAKQERFFLTMTSDLRVDPATRVDKVYTHAHLRHDRAENQTDRASRRRRRGACDDNAATQACPRNVRVDLARRDRARHVL